MYAVLKRLGRGLPELLCRFLTCAVLAAAVCLLPPARSAAGDAYAREQEKFLTLLAAVSDDPDNPEARTALIRFAAGMNAKPKLPVEAKKFYIRAMAMHIDATGTEDFDKAARLYTQAINAAPWWPQCYYNRAAALDSAGRYEEAAEDKRFYQAAKGGPEAQAAPARKAAPVKPPPKVGTRSGGADYSGTWGGGLDCWRYEFKIRGEQLTIIMHCWDFPRAVYGTGKVNGGAFEGSSPGGISGTGVGTRSPIRFKGSINEDNTEITISTLLAPELAETEDAMNAAREQVRMYGTPDWQSQTWRHMAGD